MGNMEDKNIRNKTRENKDNSGKKKPDNKIGKNGNRKNKRRRISDLERTILYAVFGILLALVISLAVKSYRLKSKLDKLSGNETGRETVATGTTADKTEKDVQDKTDAETESTSQDEVLSTETAVPLVVQGDVQYTDIEVPQNEEQENYNGDDLEDNGYPYAIKINRQENIVTVYTLDSNGYYTVQMGVACAF